MKAPVLRALILSGVIVALMWNATPLAIGGIHLYQRHLSAIAARAGYRCRLVPTCSRYAETVITRDGAIRGGWRAMKRIARCGPWTPVGTHDPP